MISRDCARRGWLAANNSEKAKTDLRNGDIMGKERDFTRFMLKITLKKMLSSGVACIKTPGQFLAKGLEKVVLIQPDQANPE
jgi:hypothetical protein